MFTVVEETAPWIEARAVLACGVRRVALVYDENLSADARILARARAIVSDARASIVEVPSAATADVRSARALAPILRGVDAVIAVGGGGILDLVAVARAIQDPRAAAMITSSQRAGLVALPLDAPPSPVLVAVPTTIGTGAESSTVATCVVEGARRLVLGRSLRADVAVLDPEATAGMPRDLYASGLVEIMLRLASPFVSAAPASAFIDSTTVALASTLGALSSAPPSRTVRHDVARIAALSHSPHLVDPSQSFATRAWYLANELSTAVTSTKIATLVDLTPLIWRRILSGDARWGRADRLRGFWRQVLPETGVEPVAGFRAWTRALGAPGLSPAQLRHIDPDHLAQTCLRRWGYGLPMLGPLRRDDLTSLFAELRNAAKPSAHDDQSPPAVRQRLREHATTKGGKT